MTNRTYGWHEGIDDAELVNRNPPEKERTVTNDLRQPDEREAVPTVASDNAGPTTGEVGGGWCWYLYVGGEAVFSISEDHVCGPEDIAERPEFREGLESLCAFAGKNPDLPTVPTIADEEVAKLRSKSATRKALSEAQAKNTRLSDLLEMCRDEIQAMLHAGDTVNRIELIQRIEAERGKGAE